MWNEAISVLFLWHRRYSCVGGKRHVPDALPTGRETKYHCTGSRVGRSEQARKMSPSPVFDPQTVQPVVSHYTDWVIPVHSCMRIVQEVRFWMTFFSWLNICFICRTVLRENKLIWIQYESIPGTAVSQWLRSCATNREVAGSIPDGVVGIFHSHTPSDRTMTQRSTQPLTEMSTRSISCG